MIFMKGRTKSKFWRVKCACGNEQNVFAAASTQVNCLVCSAQLTHARGGVSRLDDKAALVKTLE